MTSGSAPFEGSPATGTPSSDFFGQRFITNNATVAWDATARATFSLTYRYRNHVIAEGVPHNAPITLTCEFGIDPACGTVTINENGGILNVAVRPTNNWDLNGTVEMIYDDNVFTPVAPRETQHYRIHTLYRPRPWATLSGAYNDLERHNNTNNLHSIVDGTVIYQIPATVLAAIGPLDHADHSRVLSLGANLMPNEHYGLDLNYAYSDVYTATNACYQGAATVLPGGAIAPAAASQSGLLCLPYTGTRPPVIFGGKDFEDAPTQYVSAAVALSPNPKFHSNIGYRLSDVSGSRLFTDASDVNGTLVSKYQSPFVNLAYTMHPGLIWKAEYNYFGYGEGGQSGAQYCSETVTPAAGATSVTTPVLCSTLPYTAMSAGSPAYGFTAPRNFHANNITLGVHFEF